MGAVFIHLDVFARGIAVTLLLAALSGIAALASGVILASLRVSPIPAARQLGAFYVALARNTPLTILFFFAAFVLPQIGVPVGYLTAATLALSLYYAAFFCEALRSGIGSVAPGQTEAARALGLPFHHVLTVIVMPQALRTIIPPLANVLVALVKNTAVAAAFGVPELLTAMQDLANRESSAVIPILVSTALFYLAITIPIGLFAGRMERRVAFAR